MKIVNTYSLKKIRNGKAEIHTNTLDELTKYFAYTLSTGKSYEHEKGNSKINLAPKTLKGLVTNLNKAVTNAAANGYSSTRFESVEAVSPADTNNNDW